MTEFVLEEATDPTPVRIRVPFGVGTTVHLTDHMDKTLCGRPGPLATAMHDQRWWEKAQPTCQTCMKAADGKARVRREFR